MRSARLCKFDLGVLGAPDVDAGYGERLSWPRDLHQPVPRLDEIAASCSSPDGTPRE